MSAPVKAEAWRAPRGIAWRPWRVLCLDSCLFTTFDTHAEAVAAATAHVREMHRTPSTREDA